MSNGNEESIAKDNVRTRGDARGSLHSPESDVNATNQIAEEVRKEVLDEESNENDENGDEDEEESPPILKYTRINKLPPNFFLKDHISACCFDDNFFIFATHSGIIHITDIYFGPVRTLRAHKASILSLNTDGSYFASGSIDGTVVIGSIKDERDISGYDFKRPIHSVVLDKNYSRNKCFISGGMSGKVIYSSRNWLGQKSDTVLEDGFGPIVSLQLIDDLLLWMNDKGISVYHLSMKKIIAFFEKPDDSPRGDLYWPKVAFPEIDRILIGWGNYIWLLRIFNKVEESASKILPSSATISFKAFNEKEIKVEHIFRLDFLVSGILSFKDDLWMVLSYEPPSTDADERTIFNYPDLKLINSSSGEVEFEEEIGMKRVENLGLNDYMLGVHNGVPSRRFILSATDAIMVEEFQITDTIEWYKDHERYYEAWEISEHILPPLERLKLGVHYLEMCIKSDLWQDAKSFLKQFISFGPSELDDYDNKSTINTVRSIEQETRDVLTKEKIHQWEIWSTIFIETKHFEEITEVIPNSARLNLPKKIYTVILSYWLHNNGKLFVVLINKWDAELYDLPVIIGLVEERLESEKENTTLRKSIAELYLKAYMPEKSVPHLIELGSLDIVQFLATNHLLSTFIKNLPTVVSLRFKSNEIRTLTIEDLNPKVNDIIDTLVEYRHEISLSDLLKVFKESNQDFMSFLFLQALKKVDEFLTFQFGDETVRLYSQFKRSFLLPFLIKNSNYDIDKAIELCERNEYVEELVFLLGRIGKNKEALKTITDKLGDPGKAVKFAKHQNDKDAWNLLINYSMDKPAFITALLESADDQTSQFYDPISILNGVSNHIEIDGLKDSVISFSSQNDLTLLENQLILRILVKRSNEIADSFKRMKLRGLEMEIIELPQDTIDKYGAILMLLNKNLSISLKLEPDHMDSQENELSNQKLSHLKALENVFS